MASKNERITKLEEEVKALKAELSKSAEKNDPVETMFRAAAMKVGLAEGMDVKHNGHTLRVKDEYGILNPFRAPASKISSNDDGQLSKDTLDFIWSSVIG